MGLVHQVFPVTFRWNLWHHYPISYFRPVDSLSCDEDGWRWLVTTAVSHLSAAPAREDTSRRRPSWAACDGLCAQNMWLWSILRPRYPASIRICSLDGAGDCQSPPGRSSRRDLKTWSRNVALGHEDWTHCHSVPHLAAGS